MRRVISALAFVCIAQAASAEGAVTLLTCEVLSGCTSDQTTCAQTQIALSPNGVNADRVGPYDVTVDGTPFFGANLGPEGPYVWSAGPGDIRSLMLPRGATVFVLMQYNAADPRTFTETYLSCEVT